MFGDATVFVGGLHSDDDGPGFGLNDLYGAFHTNRRCRVKINKNIYIGMDHHCKSTTKSCEIRECHCCHCSDKADSINNGGDCQSQRR